MTSIKIELEGFESFERELSRVPETFKEMLNVTTQKAWSEGLMPDISHYPPKPVGSRYVRTGKLGAGWTNAVPSVTVSSSSFEADILNPVPYVGWVQGDMQSHTVTNWKKAQVIMDSDQSKVEEIYSRAITEFLAALT